MAEGLIARNEVSHVNRSAPFEIWVIRGPSAVRIFKIQWLKKSKFHGSGNLLVDASSTMD